MIVGAGDGLSASLARLLAREGMRVGLAARNVDKLRELAAATGAVTVACDAGEPDQVAAMFTTMDERLRRAAGHRGLQCQRPGCAGRWSSWIRRRWRTRCRCRAFGGFLVAQQAARRMLPRGQGAILFTGASASVKGYKLSAPFAMGKFALRGLAQSIARELAPQGIHVGAFRDRRCDPSRWPG